LEESAGYSPRVQGMAALLASKLPVEEANAVQPEMVLEPYQMIIQMDAWNIRERDGWGQTERLRRVGGGQVTHSLGLGNAKRKRMEKCGFIGVFEGFGGEDGKRGL
jgi:hypothetical protein